MWPMLHLQKFQSGALRYTSKRPRLIEHIHYLSFVLQEQFLAVVPNLHPDLQEHAKLRDGVNEDVLDEVGYPQPPCLWLRQIIIRFHISIRPLQGIPSRYIVIERPIYHSDNVTLRGSLWFGRWCGKCLVTPVVDWLQLALAIRVLGKFQVSTLVRFSLSLTSTIVSSSCPSRTAPISRVFPHSPSYLTTLSCILSNPPVVRWR